MQSNELKPERPSKPILIDYFLGSIPFVLLVVAWAIVAGMQIWPKYMLPDPVDVIQSFGEMITTGVLLAHIKASLIRLFIGVLFGAGLGVVLGILMGLNKTIAAFFDPLVNFFQSIAGIAWIPLAVLWFGFGWQAATFVIGNTVFFIVLFNTLTGIETVPQILTYSMLTMGGNQLQIIFHVLIPGALANIISGIRLGIGYGWRALLAAEMIATTEGLGFMIFDASKFFASDVIIAGIIIIGVIWLLMDKLFLQPIENRTIKKWGYQ